MFVAILTVTMVYICWLLIGQDRCVKETAVDYVITVLTLIIKNWITG